MTPNPPRVVEDAVGSSLFETPSGIRVLQVPEKEILAVGTTDPHVDVAICLCATHRQGRVLVPVQTNGAALPAWLYVGEDLISGRVTLLGGSRWPR